MTGQPPFPPLQSPPPSGSGSGEVSPALFRHRQFWLRLAAYRPLLVLGGIWILLMAIAFVAYSRLLYTGSQTPTPTAVYPHQTPPSLEATPPDAAPPDAATPPTFLPGNGDTPNPSLAGMSVGSLAVMVALCAGGCFVITRQLQAPPKPRQRRPKVVARPPVAASPQPAKPGPQRLRPYSPAEAITAPQAPTPPVTPAPTPMPTATPTAAPTQVVAPTETTSVDWGQDSLINAVDLRQRRSLSSFM